MISRRAVLILISDGISKDGVILSVRSRAPAVDLLGGGERRFFRLSKFLVNFSGLLDHVLTQREVTRKSRSEMSERSADRENQSNRCLNNRAGGDRRADFSSFFFFLSSPLFAPLQRAAERMGGRIAFIFEADGRY